MHLLACFSHCVRPFGSIDHETKDGGPSPVPPPPPIMESCASEALTNTGPVHILSVDSQPWRVASPQDQSLLSQLSPGSLRPLTWLGEGAYGCVELCRVSVSVPITPRDEDSPVGQRDPAQQPLSSNAAGECSAVSHHTLDSCDDRASGLRPTPRAEAVGLSTSSIIPAAAAATIASEAAAATIITTTTTTASEAMLSPRERVVIRPGRFSVNRLRMSPQSHDPPGPQPCATPQRTPPGYLTRLHLHSRHRPPSGSSGATAAAAGCNGAAGGASPNLTAAASPGAASGGWPATPSSAGTGRGPTDAANGAVVSGVAAFYPRQRSSGSTTTALTAATQSAPPSARSPGGHTPSQPPPAASSPHPNPSHTAAAATAAAVLSNELVVAVKRVGYRGPGARSNGGGVREPDGCAAGCTGGAVGRGRAGNGPSRTRLNRMQAIELLQLARCRECPFIVRVFGCVPDDPRAPAVGAGAAGTASGAGVPTAKQSPRPSKLSPRRPAGGASSSSSPSCRIVMEWAEGGDLGSLLKTLSARRGPCSDPSRERLLMSEASARFYMACLLEALRFLHGKMLLHRDVKPANLLLTSDGRAKLGDLGMVCHLDRDGMAAGRAGTPNYMAPEVWAYGTGPRFSSYGANADLWSAGVLLHELLTGHLPANHPDEYLKRNWTFVPRHAAFSPELRDLLTRLLTPRPRRRPQSCADVVAHPWFEGFDWKGLRDGTLPAPYVPAAHRPPGSGAAAAVTARLRPSAGAAVTAVGASGAPAGPSIRGTAGELMPPLLEENGPHATSATEGESAVVGAAGAVSLLAGRNNHSGSAGPQSGLATAAAPADPTAPVQATDSRRNDGQRAAAGSGPVQDAAAGDGGEASSAAAAAGTADAAAPSSRILPMSVWRSLGWSTAASSRPGSGVLGPGVPSAPASTVSLSVSASAGAVAPSRSGWPRRGASHGSAGSGCGSGGSAAAAGGAGGGGFGFIGAALAMALSPLTGSPKPASASVAVTGAGAAAPVHTAAGSAASGDGVNGASASAPGPSEGDQVAPVTPAGTAGVVAAAVAVADAAACGNGGRRGCKDDNEDEDRGDPRRGEVAEPGARCAFVVLNAASTKSCDCNALLLRCGATADTASATVSASDCAFVPRSDSALRWTGALGEGRGGEGLRRDSSRRLSSAGASLAAASYDSLQPPLPATSSLEAPSGPGARQPPGVLPDPSAAPQPAPPPSGHRHRPRGLSSAGALACSGGAAPTAPAVLGSGGGLAGFWRQPKPEAPQAAAPASALSLVGALASLQQHVLAVGPTGRRAGSLGWVQQRLAAAAALAVTLPDQLQSAAVAAAAAGAGGAARARAAAAAAVGRVCKSEGGAAAGADAAAAAGDVHASAAMVSDAAAVQRTPWVSAAVGAAVANGNSSPGPTSGASEPVAVDTTNSAATHGSVAPPRALSLSTTPDSPDRNDGARSACCAQTRNGAAGRAAMAAVRSSSTEWLRAATLRSATAGGTRGGRVGRHSGVDNDGGARPASSPSMLRQPLPQPPQHQQQHHWLQQPDDLSVLARDGSDAATVVVRVCASGGGGGSGSEYIGTGAGPAEKLAAVPCVAKAQEAAPAGAAAEVPRRGAAACTDRQGGGAPRSFSCCEVAMCCAGGGSTDGADPSLAQHRDLARAIPSRPTSGPHVLAASYVCASAAAAPRAAAASVVATTEVASVPADEPTAALPALPHPRAPLAGSAADAPPGPHRRTASFAFDPLDQVRPTGQSSSSPSASSPSSFTQPRVVVRSHARSHSFHFDVGGLASAGLPLSGSPVLTARAATATAGSRGTPRRREAGRRVQGAAAVRASAVGGCMAPLQPRHHRHALHTGEAALLLYMACVVMVIMAWAVARH